MQIHFNPQLIAVAVLYYFFSYFLFLMLKKFWIAFKLIPFIPLTLMFADFIDKKEYLLLTASALAGIYVYKETFQNINYFITGLIYRIKSLITGIFSFLFKIIIFIPKGIIKILSLGVAA